MWYARQRPQNSLGNQVTMAIPQKQRTKSAKKKSSRSLTYRNSFFQWEIPSSNRKSHLLFHARYSKVSVPGTAITTSFGMLRIVPALVSEIDEVMVKNPSQGWMGTHEHTNKNKKCNSF